MNEDEYIDHEMRIRILEKLYQDTNNLIRWTFGTAIVSVLVPIFLKLLIE